MGALFEILSPSTQRGARVDLGLRRLRNPTTLGRVRLAIETGHDTRACVLREVDAPPGVALDDRLAALGDALAAVDPTVFVRLLRVGRGVETGSVGIISEYVEGRAGYAGHEPPARLRAVRAAGVALFDALATLHRERGLVHGAIKPSNLLLGALGPDGDARPVRVFDLGVGALASAVTESAAGGAEARSLEEAFRPSEAMARLVGSVLCTATTWGAPGYVPLGHFAAAAPPTHGTDAFGALASLWELLTGAPLIPAAPAADDVPWSSRALAHVQAADAWLARFVDDPGRRERLGAALTAALPGAHAGALAHWLDFFDASLARGARDPAALDGRALRDALAALSDPFSVAGTLSMGGDDDDGPEVELLPAVIALTPGHEYRAAVVLDYFSAEEAPSDKGRALRFRHVSMLGEGAMGSVHRVDVLRPGEAPLPAALKIAVDDSVTNRDALLREAHVLRAQRLDGVAQFLALVELPGRSLALMMSFQPGVPLDAVLDARRLTPAEAMALGRRLLGTLVALHADATPDDPAEVVHGDIKPGNVMVPLDAHERPDFGAAVLIDFGVSRLRLRIAAPPTTTTERAVDEVLGGTVGYMPVGHLQRGATPASDVFAVAVLLYEGLTGRRPWGIANAEKYSAFGLAFATEKAMLERPSEAVRWREVPPWRRNLGWNRFFKRALGGGEPARVPAAREALVALDGVRRDVAFPAAAAAVAVVLGAAGAQWFNAAYCPAAQVRCGAAACVDLRSSERNCGACGRACGPGRVCSEGACAVSCTEGLDICAGSCRDLATDRANCGACGRACGPGQVCSNGACGVTCAEGLSLCGGACRDVRTDRANCGACGRACRAGEVCGGGGCVTSCGAGQRNCGGTCRDLATDRNHCGECGRSCDSGRVCASGRCTVSCTSGLSDCAGSCRDLATDRANCGACGRACASGEVCGGGRCGVSCAAGLTLCGGQCRDARVDSSNCGACGARCDAGERCEDGRCAVTCRAGFAACAGACRDTQADRAHCGACERSCGAGELCEGGRCALACPAGQSACSGACRETQTDEAHCGACGRACERGQSCEGGRCALACGAGLTACGDRCRDTDADPAACGACGRSCGRAEACVGGECKALARREVVPHVAPPSALPAMEPSPGPVLPGGAVGPSGVVQPRDAGP